MTSAAQRDRRLAGLEVYRVGGAVRDDRLGWPVYDNDWVVVGATPEMLRKRGFKPVGRDFPVFLHPETHEEYALARTERKSGHGYVGFSVHASPDVSLEDDLARRDLTINAMAETPEGELVDPYGGLADLKARVLRHVSQAFVEDPLRVLRTARFLARYAGLGFVIAEETQALMMELSRSGELEHLAAERVWVETEKALGEPQPEAYFHALSACDALCVLMPELVAAGEASLETALARLHEIPLSGSPSVAHWRYARLVEHLTPEARQCLAERLRLPKVVAQLARHSAASHRLLEHGRRGEVTVEAIMAWLNNLDGWRKPQQIEDQLAFIECQQPHLAEHVQRAWQAARGVEPRDLLAAGYKGGELGEALKRKRRDAVAQALSSSA
ncbi:polynucleotide adenylyltransferase [Vreelandella zhuhanensis]|uniref:polynucleotide adenylyltransferase n=1 Tax=Vreelandella zhuhanensis TaxID=2684210 RepID=UPI0029E8137E|nr:polynucleotide adenylyltransferase [Halomonas zhuhanensis]